MGIRFEARFSVHSSNHRRLFFMKLLSSRNCGSVFLLRNEIRLRVVSNRGLSWLLLHSLMGHIIQSEGVTRTG
jgi:hypothetical protein